MSTASRFLSVALFLILLAISTPAASAPSVVVLHSTDEPSPWTDEMSYGIASELGDAIGVSQVYLGTPADDDDHFDDVFERLSLQWKEMHVLAVVTDGPVAFSFMRKYREDLFVGAPVLYCAIPRPEPEYLRQCGDCSGIPLIHGVDKTVDMIFKLRPETSLLVGIMDGSQESRALRQATETAVEKYSDSAKTLFPGHEPGDDQGLDLESLRSVASSVPRSGAVLFLGFAADNKGSLIDESEAVRLLADKSVAPVYALSDEWLGDGILGGVVTSGRSLGRELGRMIKRVENGEPASEMLADPIQPHPAADLTVMARLGIPEKRLPVGTQTVNAPHRPDDPDGITPTGYATAGAALLAGFILLALLRRSRDRKDT